MLMPSYTANETTPERTFASPRASFVLAAMDRACIECLVGHTLARVERELILQTLESHHGNRTNSATVLGISIRCLRNKIRGYKRRDERVPDPQVAGRNSA